MNDRCFESVLFRVSKYDLIRAYWIDMLSIRKCSQRFYVSDVTIKKLLKYYNIECRTKSASNSLRSNSFPGGIYPYTLKMAPKKELERAYFDCKLSLRDCAKKFGLTKDTLAKVLRYYGFEPRKQGIFKRYHSLIGIKYKRKNNFLNRPKGSILLTQIQQATTGNKTEKLIKAVLSRKLIVVDFMKGNALLDGEK